MRTALSAAGDDSAAETKLQRDILGIRLSMTKTETDIRLKEIGKFVRPERKRQEVWEVNHPSFSHIIIGFEKETDQLRYVTAIARKGDEAKRVPYGEIGPTDTARQAGDVKIKNFNYQWELPPEERQPQTLVVARGRDPEFLTAWSLKRISEGQSKEREEEDEGRDAKTAAGGEKP